MPPRLKNCLNNENTVKSTAFWSPDWKKWCFEKGIAEEIENDEPTQLNALLERSNAEIEKTNMVKPRKRRFHLIESDSDTD